MNSVNVRVKTMITLTGRGEISKNMKMEQNIPTRKKLDETITILTTLIKIAIQNNIPAMNQKIILLEEIIQKIKIMNKTDKNVNRYRQNPQIQQVQPLLTNHENNKWENKIKSLQKDHTNVWKEVRFTKSEVSF